MWPNTYSSPYNTSAYNSYGSYNPYMSMPSFSDLYTADIMGKLVGNSSSMSSVDMGIWGPTPYDVYPQLNSMPGSTDWMTMQQMLNPQPTQVVEETILSDEELSDEEYVSPGYKAEYESKDELMAAVDADGNGEITKDEIKTAGSELSALGVSDINIGGEDYNLITKNGGKKIKGSDGKDLMFVTDAKRVTGKKGDDIIFAADISKKVKGGKGDDTIVTAGYVRKVKGNKGDDETYNFGNVKKVKGNKGDDTIVNFGHVHKIKGQAGENKIENYGTADKIKEDGRAITWSTAGYAVAAVAALAATVVTCGAAAPAAGAGIAAMIGAASSATVAGVSAGTVALGATAVKIGSDYVAANESKGSIYNTDPNAKIAKSADESALSKIAGVSTSVGSATTSLVSLGKTATNIAAGEGVLGSMLNGNAAKDTATKIVA